MPIRYCSQHARFLGGKHCEWIDFPVEKMQAIKALYGFFHAAHIETSAYRVIALLLLITCWGAWVFLIGYRPCVLSYVLWR